MEHAGSCGDAGYLVWNKVPRLHIISLLGWIRKLKHVDDQSTVRVRKDRWLKKPRTAKCPRSAEGV
jgi:hypothetical protein